MSAVTCVDVADILDEFALGVAPGDQRAIVIVHLEQCAACRVAVEELSETADALLEVGSRRQPSTGFDVRVMAQIHPDHQRLRLRPAILAATAAALLIVTTIATAVVSSDSPRGVRTDTRSNARDREFRTVKLVSADGQIVGDASVYAGSPAWYFMRVNHSQADTSYQCVLDLTKGSTERIGTLFVTNGHGAWGQHVHIDSRNVHQARVVDHAGQTVATATFS